MADAPEAPGPLAPAPVPDEEIIKTAATDLRFLLSHNDVSEEIQLELYRQKINTIQKFSSFFRSEDDLIQVLARNFNIDAAAGLDQRAQVAAVMVSWRESATKVKRQAEVAAEMDTRDWTKPIPSSDYIILRNSYQSVYGPLEDKVTPSKEYLEKKLQELEQGEFRAENLTEVVSRDEVDPDVMVPLLDSRGNFSIKKGSSVVALPTGPEQLRKRLSVMQNALLMLKLKYTGREEIADVEKDCFERYKDYLLGDFCWGLSSTDLHGNMVQTPPWSLVLSYEQAIRKRACALMVSEGYPFGKALQTAWKDPVVKERHFITPLALYSKRSYPNHEHWGDWNSKGKGKGKSKTKDKNKGKDAPKGASTTPEGEKICFRFNQGKCSWPKCKFLHVCSKCFKKGHNGLNCKAKTDQAPGDTQGS